MEYFLGKKGRKNLLDAITWVLEKKFKVNLANILILSKNRYFLRTKDLAFYGISPNYYRKIFPTKKELINALIKHVSGEKATNKSMTKA
jgi:hypothetical protein